MTMRSVFYLPTLLLFFALIVVGCDSTEDEEGLVGTYETVSFTTKMGSEILDIHAGGGFVDMTLRADGFVEGRLFIPELLAGENGPSKGFIDIDIRFEGTYTIAGDDITFSHDEDTFIRDVTWSFDDGRLQAETAEITIILRQE